MERRALIMTNGEYAEDGGWYRDRAAAYSLVVCVDGGTNAAVKLGIRPDLVVGDMDSISEEARMAAVKSGAQFIVFPPEKDSTDTRLAMELALGRGFDAMAVWGGIGSRPDHTLANLFSGAAYGKRGVDIRFESPDLTVYFVKDSLSLFGEIGDLVSVLTLGERAEGVCLRGFRYPLSDAVLEEDAPIGVSNEIGEPEARILVEKGMLAVFHYRIRA